MSQSLSCLPQPPSESDPSTKPITLTGQGAPKSPNEFLSLIYKQLIMKFPFSLHFFFHDLVIQPFISKCFRQNSLLVNHIYLLLFNIVISSCHYLTYNLLWFFISQYTESQFSAWLSEMSIELTCTSLLHQLFLFNLDSCILRDCLHPLKNTSCFFLHLKS
jgi:hypothetical protein